MAQAPKSIAAYQPTIAAIQPQPIIGTKQQAIGGQSGMAQSKGMQTIKHPIHEDRAIKGSEHIAEIQATGIKQKSKHTIGGHIISQQPKIQCIGIITLSIRAHGIVDMKVFISLANIQRNSIGDKMHQTDIGRQGAHGIGESTQEQPRHNILLYRRNCSIRDAHKMLHCANKTAEIEQGKHGQQETVKGNNVQHTNG